MLKIIPPVIAHRGASAYAPENTLAAFLKAVELGITWVELDVQMTSEGTLVVFHDQNLQRTTNGQGDISDCTHTYLSALDAGSWFSSAFQGEKIPTFEETILFLKKHGLFANVEIKSKKGRERKIVEKVLTLLEKYAVTGWMISSFDIAVLRIARELHCPLPLGLLMREWLPHWQMLADELECVSVNLSDEISTLARVDEILSTNRSVLVYTVNDISRVQQLLSWGVTAVFSDCPDNVMI